MAATVALRVPLSLVGSVAAEATVCTAEEHDFCNPREALVYELKCSAFGAT